MRWSISCKNAKVWKNFHGYALFQTLIFQTLPQNSKFGSLFFVTPAWGLKIGMPHPCWTKTYGGDRFSRSRPISAQGHTLETSWSEIPTQKLPVWSWTGPENFIKILVPSKVIQLFNLDRQTDKWMPSHPYTNGWIFAPFLIPFTIFERYHFKTL